MTWNIFCTNLFSEAKVLITIIVFFFKETILGGDSYLVIVDNSFDYKKESVFIDKGGYGFYVIN